MFEDYQICPYTGLRSFTEEESLYFKGREEHIDQATEQLQRNKFLMLTGASGDGKSSLVYAGIVPNARAGFLKSKYTQWGVADFRPERTPFSNLCRAVAKQLDIANPQIVESELQHGFSALADLYKNSRCYVDVDSIEWQKSNEAERAALKRGAANLIILVDQFEEFFTNPENYHRGVPSRDSNLVLNILLETSRIALEENLPIYIVFTMRSDYIGQCAAFRGLPEYIGFSQFFVPRLNRSQLQQVIEEPAALSGNRITRRLTERLILDLTEGVDQLPILQHALNQIWLAANNGIEEMDLIHYAMVGGMSAGELPEDQVSKFNQWFNGLTAEIKACYHRPNLQNVLDTHTNKLYQQAAIYYQNKTGKSISEVDAKIIIRTAFICLTKIDQSRAVRNRMTLNEITNILGRPEFDTKVVGDILNIFREPGNTFIRPFITDDPETNELKPDQVLDITHESLIRNWEFLEQWAKEEYDDYTISLDFGAQLNRWVKSGKSNAFLFSIGPLTYFESWFNKVNPNIYWIARYLPEDISQEKKLIKAKKILSDSNALLAKSARKHIVTRTIVRYGPKRIATVLGVLTILILSSFAVRSYLYKQNSFVLKSIQEETLQLANNKKVAFDDKILLLCEELRLGQVTLTDIINNIDDPLEKINIVGGIPMALVYQGRNEPSYVILKSLLAADSLLEIYPKEENNVNRISGVLNELNDLSVTLDVANFYNHTKELKELRKKIARRGAEWVLRIIESQPNGFTDMKSLSMVLDNSLNRGAFTAEELDKLIRALSPFTQDKKNTWHQTLFQPDNLLVKGVFGYGFKFNGLYQELGYLYAAAGNSARTLQCVDSLLRYNSNYFDSDYATGIDNAANIASVFYLNGKVNELDSFVKGYCVRKKISEEEFYNSLITKFMTSITTNSALHFHGYQNVSLNLNLRFTDVEQVKFFFAKYRDVVATSTLDKNLRNFQMAVSYKNEGIFTAKFSKNYSESLNKDAIYPLFDKAYEFYKLIDTQFLESDTELKVMSDVIIIPQKSFFIYPDFLSKFNPNEPRQGMVFFISDYFLQYILDKGYFNSFYATERDFLGLTVWLDNYETFIDNPVDHFVEEMEYPVMVQLDKELAKSTVDDKLDYNLLYFYLGRKSLDLGEPEKALHYYQLIKHENLNGALKLNNRIIRLVANEIIDLLTLERFNEAYSVIRIFKNNINRSNLYAYAAGELTMAKVEGNMVSRLIDSARVEMNRTKDLATGQPNRQQLAYALALVDPVKNKDEEYRIIKNVNGKTFTMMRITRAYAFHANLYGGMENIPANISYSSRSNFLWGLLYGYNEGLADNDNAWSQFSRGHQWWIINWIPYVDDDE